MATKAPSASDRKPVRVWADGCFDFMHYGHQNALRQAKALGDVLVVGVHLDAEILANKGPPVMNEQERYAAVRACKWVDEVVENAPYVVDIAVLDEHNIDFVTHGEDISTDAEGRDVYECVKRSGRYREIKRTNGVSTTDIVGRMLLLTRSSSLDDSFRSDAEAPNVFSSLRQSEFLPTTRMLAEFSEGCKSGPQEGDRVVYIDGAFDVFHPGHAQALEEAKRMGDFLLVGVHTDDAVASLKGPTMPIQQMHERVLSVLSCRAVDEVVVGAPVHISEAMLSQMRIDIVAHGTTSDYMDFETGNNARGDNDPFRIPKEKGIFRMFQSPFPSLTTSEIVSRIIRNRLRYEQRNRRKLEAAVLQRAMEQAA